MKIVKTIYQYKYSAREILSSLSMKIIMAVDRFQVFQKPIQFVETADPASTIEQHYYYERNRKINEAISEMFESLTCELVLDRQMSIQMSAKDTEGYVKSKIASLIASELIKTDKIVIVGQDNLYGDIRFTVEIPFLKSKHINNLQS